MINFLEKLVSMLIGFCLGCYITANHLDKNYVEEQKNRLKDNIESFISGSEIDLQ